MGHRKEVDNHHFRFIFLAPFALERTESVLGCREVKEARGEERRGRARCRAETRQRRTFYRIRQVALPDESVLISVAQMWKVHSLFKGEYLFAALNAAPPTRSPDHRAHQANADEHL